MSRFAPVQLDDRLWFPDPREAVARGPMAGLVAVGGDLSPERLLLAYRSGLFPWTAQPVTWWSPNPHAIFELDEFHISRSLARTIRRGVFEVTVNKAFAEVMRGCARPDRPGGWITEEFIEAYTRLHALGHAHSVECWKDSELAGGIYGVALGGLFAGESMFHRVTDASKIALASLVQRLRERGFALFDIQMVTNATEQLGAIEIRRSEYLRRLGDAVKLDCKFAG